MQLAYIYQAWEWLTVKKKKKKKKKKKPEISTNRESNSANHDRSIAPHGVGWRGPLKGPWWWSRGRSPPKLLGFSRFGPTQPNKLNTFASYIKLYVDAVTNNAYLDY